MVAWSFKGKGGEHVVHADVSGEIYQEECRYSLADGSTIVEEYHYCTCSERSFERAEAGGIAVSIS